MEKENQNNESKDTKIYIKEFEDMEAQKKFSKNVNYTIYWAYKYSKKANNELLNFYERIWEQDVESMVKIFKTNGIKEFSISSGISASCLALFEKFGCKMCGLIEANDVRNMNSVIEKVPAIKMEML